MQEIEEGNRIIYDAAGEEANVIFGLVNKEDLNEYVSYTVIATGFDSHGQLSGISTTKPKTEEKKDKTMELGGFNVKKFELENTEDLDVPTIFRVKGSKNSLLEDNSFSRGGYKFEQIDAFDAEPKSKKKSAEDDEEDSSSFLRMMMD